MWARAFRQAFDQHSVDRDVPLEMVLVKFCFKTCSAHGGMPLTLKWNSLAQTLLEGAECNLVQPSYFVMGCCLIQRLSFPSSCARCVLEAQVPRGCTIPRHRISRTGAHTCMRLLLAREELSLKAPVIQSLSEPADQRFDAFGFWLRKALTEVCATYKLKDTSWSGILKSPRFLYARDTKSLEALNPKPSTRNPKPQTLNPKPSTLNPKP